MSQRRIVVIGSQCQALGNLPFLPQAARDLYAVMTDPERGGCVSAIEGGGLLINPTVEVAKEAIKSAYLRASADEATLFISYIGHGERAGEDFYLLPQDAGYPPVSDTAVHLINLIKETHRTAPGQVDGLGVLVDACYSGNAGFGAAQAWTRALEGTLRFELLTAAADRPAADGCFSRNIVRLLREGISTAPSEHLLCIHLRPLIKAACPNQEPQHPSYNPDETLWLARNAGRILEPWAQTPAADEVQRLTLGYQPTPALGEVVEHSREQRCLVVLGEAGAGKSALAAALAWLKVAEAIVPAGFVQAIALFTEATTPLDQGAGECARVQRIVRGESAIAVETRSCKRAAARGSAEMTPAAEMRAAEMPTAMVAAATIMRAPMTTAVMTTAVSTAMATTVTTATFSQRHILRPTPRPSAQ